MLATESRPEIRQRWSERPASKKHWSQKAVGNESKLAPRVTPDLPYMRAPSTAALTMQEARVIQLAALGNTNKQIGVQLKISEQTVKNHFANILRKTRACDRTHAVYLFFMPKWFARRKKPAVPIPSPGQKKIPPRRNRQRW